MDKNSASPQTQTTKHPGTKPRDTGTEPIDPRKKGTKLRFPGIQPWSPETELWD